MPGHQCHHCKQWVDDGEAHDCWTTTETALTRGLSEDLRDAWERLRETAAALGEQRIYASHHSIMFSRTTCYFFVRPKRKFLEVCVFLGRVVHAAQVRRATPASKSKIVHVIHVTHRDQVEAPITDWIREAYEREDQPRAGVGSPTQDAPGRAAPAKTTAGARAVKRPRRSAVARATAGRRARK